MNSHISVYADSYAYLVILYLRSIRVQGSGSGTNGLVFKANNQTTWPSIPTQTQSIHSSKSSVASNSQHA